MLEPKSLIPGLICALFWTGMGLGAAGQTGGSPLQTELPPITTERLSNGVRVIHLPVSSPDIDDGNFTEIAFGYTVGVRNEPGYPVGIAELTRFYLAASVRARSVALVAHLGGGEFEFIHEPDRIGMRVGVPESLVETTLIQVGAYLAELDFDPEMFEYARRRLVIETSVTEDNFGLELDREVGAALLRDYPYLWSERATMDQVEQLQVSDLATYFQENFGTDRAWVVVSRTVSSDALGGIREITPRQASHSPATNALPDPIEIEFDFPSRARGGVVLARAVPSVHFEGWFRALVVDRMLREVVPPPVTFQFGFGVDPVLHRIDIPVEIPLFAEDVRDDLLRQIAELQFRNPDPDQLSAAMESAKGYLKQRNVLEWFAAQDLWSSLEAGWDAIPGLTRDGFRSAVRDFSGLGRVVALWPPAFEQPRVTVESLSEEIAEPPEPPPPLGRAPGSVSVPGFDQLAFPDPSPVRVERLDSGVTLAEDSGYGIFIAGRFDGVLPDGEASVGTNGSFWLFPDPPGDAVFEQLQEVRPDRLLVFAPAPDLPGLGQRLNGWTGGRLDSTPSLAAGQVARGDIPSLMVLKTWLEAKVVEAGWWGQVNLGIEGIEGSRLIIEADAEQDAQVRAWIRDVAENGLEEEEFLRVRSATLGYFDRIRRELQILLWQRDPRGTIQLPTTVSQARLRDVARIYF